MIYEKRFIDYGPFHWDLENVETCFFVTWCCNDGWKYWSVKMDKDFKLVQRKSLLKWNKRIHTDIIGYISPTIFLQGTIMSTRLNNYRVSKVEESCQKPSYLLSLYFISPFLNRLYLYDSLTDDSVPITYFNFQTRNAAGLLRNLTLCARSALRAKG